MQIQAKIPEEITKKYYFDAILTNASQDQIAAAATHAITQAYLYDIAYDTISDRAQGHKNGDVIEAEALEAVSRGNYRPDDSAIQQHLDGHILYIQPLTGGFNAISIADDSGMALMFNLQENLCNALNALPGVTSRYIDPSTYPGQRVSIESLMAEAEQMHPAASIEQIHEQTTDALPQQLRLKGFD